MTPRLDLIIVYASLGYPIPVSINLAGSFLIALNGETCLLRHASHLRLPADLSFQR